MEQERQFKGVWIPAEIWLDERLNMLEKGILTEIDSLDNENGCSAGNDYLANFCQCSETKVSTAIKKLIELGYIYLKSFDGRIRILKSRLSKNERQTLKNLNTDFKKVKEINKNNNTSINNNILCVFDFWNKSNIINHREITPIIQKAIEKALKLYTLQDVEKCITRYSQVVNDKTYYFNYKWTLQQFLSRKEGMPEFMDDGGKWLNYCEFKKKGKNVSNFTERNYDESEINVLSDLDNLDIL